MEALHCSTGRRAKPSAAGEGGIPRLLRPAPSGASTSCESAEGGPGRRTTPSPSTKSLAEDAAAVPPEPPGDGPDVLVCVGGGLARRGQKASASRRNRPGSNLSHREPSEERGSSAKAAPPPQPPRQVTSWANRCE